MQIQDFRLKTEKPGPPIVRMETGIGKTRRTFLCRAELPVPAVLLWWSAQIGYGGDLPADVTVRNRLCQRIVIRHYVGRSQSR